MTAPQQPRNKILHLISGDLWAGAETMACNLLRQLKNYSELDITIILFNEGRLANELRASGLTVQVVDESRHPFWELLRRTRAFCGSHPPDIIHSHRYKENVIAYLLSRMFPGTKLVATQHGLPETVAQKQSLAHRLKRQTNFFILSHKFKTVAVSEDIRNTLITSYGFKNDAVDVIHNGINMPTTVPSVPKDQKRFVIGSSGRLFPIKDYPLMVEIARSVVASGDRDIFFELAGDGPELHAVNTLIERYGLQDRFLLKGHVDDMETFYRGLDIYLNTSVHEGIPMTILEAMAHGLPVIAPAVGGISEIFDDGTEGFLVTTRKPDDFAQKCLLLHANQSLWTRFSKAAKEKAELFFSAEKMAESYYRLYKSMYS